MARATITAITVALALTPTLGAVKPKAAFLAVSLQPEKIARTLVSVQDEWKAQVALFASCDGVGNASSNDDGDLLLVDCRRAPNAFGKSCDTVVQALTQASNGDRDVVNEYMQDICGHSEILEGWRQSQCQVLANSILSAMSVDAYANRAKESKVCTDLWSKFLSEEHSLRDGERKAAASKAADEAKEAAQAKAKVDEAAKKRADDEAKAEEEEEAAKARAAKAKAEETAAKARAKAKAKADEETRAKSAKLAKKTSHDGTVTHQQLKDQNHKAKHKVKTSSRVNASTKRAVKTMAPKHMKTSAKHSANATAPKHVK